MDKIQYNNLYSLEKYEKIRPDFRKKIIDYKKNRRLEVGPNVTYYFEDYLTMHYQVQEVLRIERLFKLEDIEDEINRYNPLVPDGNNWKVTMIIGFNSVEHNEGLVRMMGIEHSLWMQIGEFNKIKPFCNEDLDDIATDKVSFVHFLRFELTDTMKEALQNNAPLYFGIDHPGYSYSVAVSTEVRDAIMQDLL